MGAFFGAVSHRDVVLDVFFGVDYHSHLGTRRAGIIMHDAFYGFDLPTYWQVAVMALFLLYYIRALLQYGRWLHDNYADLEHKEVWQSLLFVIALFVIYETYFTNPGEMAREYLSQFFTIAIVALTVYVEA